LGCLQTFYRLRYRVLYRFATSAALDLDDPDDFGRGYLAQTIFKRVSAEVAGGTSDQSSVVYCSFDRVFPAAIDSECKVADRI